MHFAWAPPVELSPFIEASPRIDQAISVLRGRPRLRRRPFFGGRPTLLCVGTLSAIVRAFETGANSMLTFPSEEMRILSIIKPACCTPLIRSETFISFSYVSRNYIEYGEAVGFEPAAARHAKPPHNEHHFCRRRGTQRGITGWTALRDL